MMLHLWTSTSFLTSLILYVTLFVHLIYNFIYFIIFSVKGKEFSWDQLRCAIIMSFISFRLIKRKLCQFFLCKLKRAHPKKREKKKKQEEFCFLRIHILYTISRWLVLYSLPMPTQLPLLPPHHHHLCHSNHQDNCHCVWSHTPLVHYHYHCHRTTTITAATMLSEPPSH